MKQFRYKKWNSISRVLLKADLLQKPYLKLSDALTYQPSNRKLNTITPYFYLNSWLIINVTFGNLPNSPYSQFPTAANEATVKKVKTSHKCSSRHMWPWIVKEAKNIFLHTQILVFIKHMQHNLMFYLNK